MTVTVAILTVSDRVSAGSMEDLGGPAVEAAANEAGWTVVNRAVVPDEADRIAEMLREWSDASRADVIFTTGGTGLGPRDVTPEATLRVAERRVPGIAETIRSSSLSVTPFAMLSRGVSVLRNRTVIINLPGSPSGARDGVRVVAPVLAHAVAMLAGGRH